MAKKKKATPPEDTNGANGSQPESTKDLVHRRSSPEPTSSTSTSTSISTVIPPKSKALAPTPQQQPQAPSSPALIICRNKHWRYISSFHGPWLQSTPEALIAVAHINYNHPRPRPIDPAVVFDLAKIRRLVEEATNLAVRAASGTVSSAGSHHHNQLPGASAYGLGAFGPPGGGRGPKLSAERRHRLRVDATKRLNAAYHLDEIACSVATMQSASTLENVADLVLQRSPDDADAKYVHFFHEKIPSRHLAESTSLKPLDEVIAERRTDGEPLRTRATVRIFKEDYEGAAADLTEALRVVRYRQSTTYDHKTPEGQLTETSGRRVENIILDDDKQPSSLEVQLLFQRAGVYLTIACQHVHAALPEPPTSEDDDTNDRALLEPSGTSTAASTAENGDPSKEEATVEAPTPPEPSPEERRAEAQRLEARKVVRDKAKRALRDYMDYLSHFDYSPDLPTRVAEEFARRVNGYRGPRRPDDSPSTRAPPAPHKLYSLKDLFSPTPPPDIPPFAPFPSPSSTPSNPLTIEALTHHPLLPETLHSLLLTHALLQTSPTELLRHAHMAARLARLADGAPLFQPSRSPARADWVDVLRAARPCAADAADWEALCGAAAPAPRDADGASTSTGSGSAVVVMSERAAAVVRWVREAPAGVAGEVGGGKRRRKGGRKAVGVGLGGGERSKVDGHA